jgi:hypothetical protein
VDGHRFSCPGERIRLAWLGLHPRDRLTVGGEGDLSIRLKGRQFVERFLAAVAVVGQGGAAAEQEERDQTGSRMRIWSTGVSLAGLRARAPNMAACPLAYAQRAPLAFAAFTPAA